MAIIIYECDTCKRPLEKIRNTSGLEIMGNCIITDGCKGKLHQTDIKPASIVSSAPAPVSGLVDYIQRKVLYTHEQTLLSEVWSITHNLNAEPSVQIFVYDDDENNTQLIEIESDQIEIISNNELSITLSRAFTGVAQLIARSSNEGQTFNTFEDNIPEIETTATFQLSTSNELTIATLYNSPTEDYLDITFTFLTPNTFEKIEHDPMRFESINTALSPWGDASLVLIQGKLYTVRSQTINTNDLSNAGVQEASPFYVSTITNGASVLPSFETGQVFVLLTNSPYTSFDKVFSSFVDLAEITESNAAATTLYASGEFRSVNQLRQDAFPLIQIPNI